MATARRTPLWFWGVGFLGGFLVAAPLLAGDTLLTLDLAATPNLKSPDLWLLGGNLPRRGLWWLALDLPSTWFGGGRTATLALITMLAFAFVGCVRLVGDRPAPYLLAAGSLYAFGPFVFTRIGVGHFSLVFAMAVAPWTLSTLARADTNLAATYRWSVALALGGPFGGLIALVIVTASVAARCTRRLAGIAVVVAAQLVWIVPGLLAAARPGSGEFADASAFATRLGSPLGVLRLFAGDGFWSEGAQVGLHQGQVTALVGAVLAGLAIFGTPELPDTWRRTVATAAGLATVVAIAPSTPGVAPLFDAITRFGPFVLLREPQRLLAVTLLWLAPGAAAGAHRLARRFDPSREPIVRAAPVALAMMLAGPGLWGAGGLAVSIDAPADWEQVRSIVSYSPGTTVALPFTQHLDLPIANRARVLNPLPDLLPGDVIASSAIQVQIGRSDRIDRRQLAVIDALGQHEPASDGLTRLGVRWIADLVGVDRNLDSRLADDTGMTLVVNGPSLRLYELRSWEAQAHADNGHPVSIRSPLPMFAVADTNDPFTWYRNGGWGWVRGTVRASDDPNGSLHIGSAAGVLWYWPATIALLTYVATAVGLAASWDRGTFRAPGGILAP